MPLERVSMLSLPMLMVIHTDATIPPWGPIIDRCGGPGGAGIIWNSSCAVLELNSI